MDNIIFENPSQPRKKKASSHVSVPVARYDTAIEQAPGPIDPCFSHDTNFDLHAHDKEPVSLYEIFSLSGDEEMGNEDLIVRSPQALSPVNINGEQEWAVSGTRGSAEDVIPIDPAILQEDNVREKNGAHEQAQIIEPPTPVSDAISEPQRLPSKRRRSNETHRDNPRKRCRNGSLPAKDQHCTLYSCFSAAPLHERLEFLAWLLRTGLSESLSAASLQVPVSPVKMTDQDTDSARTRRRRPLAIPNKGGVTSTKSGKRRAWEPDEIKLLVTLKEEGLSWSMIAKRFSEQFPGRSQGTMQVYWSQKLQYLHKKSHPGPRAAGE
uniref:Myb-like domain-containing protein n=1 Tax=Talaromyces marneffei PM1 TaxID=1077442 RepID=A0A093VE44_TALMA